jgi:RNA polymerase sigma factor (sigma-70 family)
MTCPLDDLSDSELLAKARAGDGPAYGVLFKRHWQAGRAMATSITGRFDPDDLASEAFVRILRAVEKGNGPKTGFRSYLATTIRNVAIDWSRRKSMPNIEDPDAVEDWTYSEVTALEKIERETMAKAFYALPDSWQEVLWYTEVEDMAPREVAPLLGLTPNAVSALAARAREGLRQSWINAHLADVSHEDPEHAWVLSKLGSHARGRLSRSDRAKVLEHLEACDPCADAAEEARHVGSRLALGILPLFLGVGGAVAYLAWAGERSGGAVAAEPPGAEHHPTGTPAPDPSASTVRGASEAVTTAGRLGHVAGAGASAANSGLAAVAAVVAAAVLATSAVIAAPASNGAGGAEAGGAVSTSADRPPGPSARGDGDRGDETSQPRGSTQAPHSGSPTPPTPTPTPVPPARRADEPLAPAEDHPPQAAPVQPEDSPARPEPSPTPPREQPAPPRVDTAPPAQEDRCEAAVRTVPSDDILFGYRLDDPGDATLATDFVHGSTGRYAGTPGQPGWTLADDTLREPTDEFTIQIRFKTEVGGGRLIGFSLSKEGDSRHFDRHLFLTDDGRVVFGVYPGWLHTISSSQSYSDGVWHQATATLSADGMNLYVDGERVASNPSVTRAQSFSGYWRIGYESLFNWGADTPANWIFGGTLSHAAVYRSALTAEQVRAQWKLCG